MRILGLLNQWGTVERLLEHWEVTNVPDDIASQNQAMHDLFRHLQSCAGPDLWAGTSHSQVNLVNRDTIRNEHVPHLVTFEVYCRRDEPLRTIYRIGYRRVVGKRPTSEWLHTDTDDIEEATALILDAVSYSGVPQRNRPK